MAIRLPIHFLLLKRLTQNVHDFIMQVYLLLCKHFHQPIFTYFIIFTTTYCVIQLSLLIATYYISPLCPPPQACTLQNAALKSSRAYFYPPLLLTYLFIYCWLLTWFCNSLTNIVKCCGLIIDLILLPVD